MFPHEFHILLQNHKRMKTNAPCVFEQCSMINVPKASENILC
jgi:hypothetical protein